MRLFKKRNENNFQEANNKIATKVVAVILKIQSWFAQYMGKRTQKLSFFSWKLYLISFLLSGSMLSIYLMISAFSHSARKKSFQIDRIITPRFDENTETVIHHTVISPDQYNKVKAFESYMDSLQKRETGKHIYDSLVRIHPKLLDSARMLEEIYQSQNKK